MRSPAASRSSRHALDQWGVQFPLPVEDLDELAQPASPSLARLVTTWRVAIATARSARGSALEQWGIEFPVPEGEFAALARYRGQGCLRTRNTVLGGRMRGLSQAGAWAAILAVVVAGSAMAVNPSVSAGAVPPSVAPNGGQPAAVAGVDPSQVRGVPSISARPATIPNPTPEPTPGAASSSEPVPINPRSDLSAFAAPAARVLEARSRAVPTIEDARNYLTARLGTNVDRRWGMSQSQCASLIFEYESRWNPHATNKSSGAYGLPQANPASKLGDWAESRARAADEAGDPNTAWLYRAWRDNPVVQAEWGVDYMVDRYGSPCAALAYRSGTGWY